VPTLTSQLSSDPGADAPRPAAPPIAASHARLPDPPRQRHPELVPGANHHPNDRIASHRERSTVTSARRAGPLLPDVGSLNPPCLCAADLFLRRRPTHHGGSRGPNPLSKADASIRRSPSTFPRGHRPASTVGDQTSWDSVLSTYVKENFLRFWKPRLALASSAAAGLALAAALVVPRAVIDVLLMIIIVCTLVGLYLLRRYARAELLYHRHAERGRQTPRTEPVSGNQPSAPDRPLGSPPRIRPDKITQ
jgi:hypothetical protein